MTVKLLSVSSSALLNDRVLFVAPSLVQTPCLPFQSPALHLCDQIFLTSHDFLHPRQWRPPPPGPPTESRLQRLKNMVGDLPSPSGGSGGNIITLILGAVDSVASRISDVVEGFIPVEMDISRSTLELLVKVPNPSPLLSYPQPIPSPLVPPTHPLSFRPRQGLMLLTVLGVLKSLLNTALLVGGAALAYYVYTNSEVPTTSRSRR